MDGNWCHYGGVWRLMANGIKKFHIFFLNLPLRNHSLTSVGVNEFYLQFRRTGEPAYFKSKICLIS